MGVRTRLPGTAARLAAGGLRPAGAACTASWAASRPAWRRGATCSAAMLDAAQQRSQGPAAGAAGPCIHWTPAPPCLGRRPPPWHALPPPDPRLLPPPRPSLPQSLVGSDNFTHILRVLNTNVDGKQKIMYALTAIKGIGRRFSNICCKKAEVDLSKR